MDTARSDGRRVYAAGGGPKNTMSLAQLTAWCDERFGHHSPSVDCQPRPYDIPWVAMDNSKATTDFGWHVEMPLRAILDE
jgi:CDP-paratose 2-epimerase